MIKYFLYARKSTDSEDRQILSIEAQIEECRQYAQKERLFIADVFTESRTAKEPGRPVFNEMIARIEKGEAEGILAWHPDRLARNSLDGGKIIYLIDKGIIKDLKFPTYRFDNTAQGKFMLSITFSQTKYYVDNLSENIKRGHRQKLRKGIWPGWAPIGYLNDRENHNIIPDPEKQRFIKRIFELYATGKYSFAEIRDIVHKAGLRGKKGKVLTPGHIQRILKNPFYYGVFRFKGELYQASHKPIISKTLYAKVQEVMKKRKHIKKEKKEFVFRGFIRDGECGCMITAERQKGHNYYRCTKRKQKCSQPYTREEALSEEISDRLKEITLGDKATKFMLKELEREREKEIREQEIVINELKEKLKQLEEKLDKLLDAYISSYISADEYLSKKERYINQKIETKEKLEELKGKSGVWFELCWNFINACNYLEKVKLDENLAIAKEYLQKAGSNFYLIERRVKFN